MKYQQNHCLAHETSSLAHCFQWISIVVFPFFPLLRLGQKKPQKHPIDVTFLTVYQKLKSSIANKAAGGLQQAWSFQHSLTPAHPLPRTRLRLGLFVAGFHWRMYSPLIQVKLQRCETCGMTNLTTICVLFTTLRCKALKMNFANLQKRVLILLMAEILHHLGCMKPYK